MSVLFITGAVAVAIAKLGIYGYAIGEAVAVVTALYWSHYSRL